MTLQGYPRSLILAPIESARGTSYWPSIVTLVIYRRVSEISQLLYLYAEAHFLHTSPIFRPKFRGVPFGVDPCYWNLQRVNALG